MHHAEDYESMDCASTCSRNGTVLQNGGTLSIVQLRSEHFRDIVKKR